MTTIERIVYRATKRGVDPDAVNQTLRLNGAIQSLVGPTRTLYQFAECSVEIFNGVPAVLFVTGPTEAAARHGISRLGYDLTDVTVTPIKLIPLGAHR